MSYTFKSKKQILTLRGVYRPKIVLKRCCRLNSGRTGLLEATLQKGKDPMDVQWTFRILEKWCCSLNSGSTRVTEVPRAVCEGAGGCWRLVNSHLKQPPLQQKQRLVRQYLILIKPTSEGGRAWGI